MTFREYLREKFTRTYIGLDDEMPDAEGDWFSDLDPDQVIVWAEQWGAQKKIDGFKRAMAVYDKTMDACKEAKS